MRLFTVFGILFYATVIILVGLILISFSILLSFNNNFLQPQNINSLIAYMQANFTSRIITFLSGLLLILISFSFAQLMLGRIQREKTIAFKTASGEVTIALTAVEDLIKRLTGVIPEIRDLKPDVRASKKGIEVDLRVVLKSEANIPELTERLQELTKSKIQEVLGVEEQIMISIHVAKIAAWDEKDKKKKDPISVDPAVPFGGYNRA